MNLSILLSSLPPTGCSKPKVEEFYVLKCHSCNFFQVQTGKKTRKWTCKMCKVKQTIIKVFDEGTAKHCRLLVQHLNQLNITEEESNFCERPSTGRLQKDKSIPNSGGIVRASIMPTDVGIFCFPSEETIAKQRSKRDSYLKVDNIEKSLTPANVQSKKCVNEANGCDMKRRSEWDLHLEVDSSENSLASANDVISNQDRDEVERCIVKRKTDWDWFFGQNGDENQRADVNVVNNEKDNIGGQPTKKSKWDSYMDSESLEDSCEMNSQWKNILDSAMTDSEKGEWNHCLESHRGWNSCEDIRLWAPIDEEETRLNNYMATLSLNEGNYHGLKKEFSENLSASSNAVRSSTFWDDIDFDNIDSLLEF